MQRLALRFPLALLTTSTAHAAIVCEVQSYGAESDGTAIDDRAKHGGGIVNPPVKPDFP